MPAPQYGTTLRNALLQAYIDTIGTAPTLTLRTGAPPANCAASDAGSAIVAITLPSTWMTTPSAGASAMSGTWQGTSSATGTIGHYRVTKSGTCHEQGTVTQAFGLTTTAATPANNNTLTFAATTGVSVGQSVVGPGIPTGATVLAVTATTVSLSAVSTAGVASGASIYFGDTSGGLWANAVAIASVGTLVVVVKRTLTAPGA
jgi:hypothetical protein